jgi:hypothetical protein
MFAFSRIVKAGAVRAPIPLSVRYDSLLVQCMIAAAVYFGPQDAAVAVLAAMAGRAQSNSVNKPSDVADPNASLEKFYAKKGISGDAFRVAGGSTYHVRFANMYK